MAEEVETPAMEAYTDAVQVAPVKLPEGPSRSQDSAMVMRPPAVEVA